MRAKQAQAWQKLQLTQMKRAAHTMTHIRTPQALALDRLTDKLMGRNAGAQYEVECTAFDDSIPVIPGECCCWVLHLQQRHFIILGASCKCSCSVLPLVGLQGCDSYTRVALPDIGLQMPQRLHSPDRSHAAVYCHRLVLLLAANCRNTQQQTPTQPSTASNSCLG